MITALPETPIFLKNLTTNLIISYCQYFEGIPTFHFNKKGLCVLLTGFVASSEPFDLTKIPRENHWSWNQNNGIVHTS